MAYHEEMRKFWLGTYPKRRARGTVRVGDPVPSPVGPGSGEQTGLLSPDGGELHTSEALIGSVDDGQSPCDSRDRTPTRRISVASLLGDTTHPGNFVVEILDKERLNALPSLESSRCTEGQLGRTDCRLVRPSGDVVVMAVPAPPRGEPPVRSTPGVDPSQSAPQLEGVDEAR